MHRRYFPKGIAQGDQFFNREEPLKRLIDNLKGGVHTLILAPRRYGKSSLAKKAIAQCAFPCTEIDLFVAVDEYDIGQKIISGIEAIIQKTSKKPEQWIKSLQNYFTKSNKKWTIGLKGLKLELIPQNIKTPADNILDVLNALEYILLEKKLKAVIFIDEFQEIAETKMAKAIEGAIRHFAQESERVSFIFSGSSRSLLKKIFKNNKNPLFGLCDEINLGRIDAKYYHIYLQKIAEKTFKAKIDQAVIDEILSLTECHPRYVYAFCFEIWVKFEAKPPTLQEIKTTWQDYVNLNQKDIREILSARTHTQRKLLETIALGNDQKLSTYENQQRLQLTSSSIVQALKVLEQQDFIEKTPSGNYRLIDPLIKHAFITVHYASDP